MEAIEVQQIIHQELKSFQNITPKRSSWLDWHKWLNTMLLGIMGYMVVQLIADFRGKMQDNADSIKRQTENIISLSQSTTKIVTLMEAQSKRIQDLEEGKHISTADRYTRSQALLDMDKEIRKEIRELRLWSLETFEKKK